MLVGDRMTAPAVTITADVSFQDVLRLMRERRVRRFPVVDEMDRLIGIVSERDLLHASPSPATSLSVWELNYLLWKLKVEEIMTRDVLSVYPTTPIEDAARLMVEKRIGGLPVVTDQGFVLGVITETDIFKAFVEMLGGGEPGLRLIVEVPPGKGVLASLAQAIADLGGNIVSVGSFAPESTGERRLTVKVHGVSKDQLTEKLEALGDHVLDAREV